MPFFHIREVYLPSFFLPQVKMAGENHRRIGMRIQRDDTLVERLSLFIEASLGD